METIERTLQEAEFTFNNTRKVWRFKIERMNVHKKSIEAIEAISDEEIIKKTQALETINTYISNLLN